jgi:uncharacterized protein
MDLLPLIGTFLVALFASFAGTAVGGFGLLIVPLLIFLGLPPQTAVATCRIGLVAGNATSIYKFHQRGKVNYQIGIPLILVSVLGAYLGSRLLLSTSGDLFEKIFGVFILFILLLTLCKKDMGVKQKMISNPLVHGMGYILQFLIGGMSAFFSGGSGILGRTVLMLFFGQTFLESAGTRKLQSVAVGLTSATVYIMSGIVNWTYALVLVVSIALGSYFGSVYALKKGDAWVRKLFMVAVFLAALRLLL